MYAVPLEAKEAAAYIEKYHRHHKPTKRDKFRVGCAEDGELIGVIQVGRPLARMLCDGQTLEVLRCCTNGKKNVCSFLYSRAARIAKELGYKKIITYILESEGGASLRASGWICESKSCGGNSWNTPSRPRELTQLTIFGEVQKYPTEKNKGTQNIYERGQHMNKYIFNGQEKTILDVTCGPRSIWFNKQNPRALYCDVRRESHEMEFGKEFPGTRRISVDPDIIADFTNLPFDADTFQLVVFDPPHMVRNGPNIGWIEKQYGRYTSKAEALESIRDGVRECIRVLRPGGALIFKWSETSITTREILDAIGIEPLFGHKSGKKSTTHWICFIKD